MKDLIKGVSCSLVLATLLVSAIAAAKPNTTGNIFVRVLDTKGRPVEGVAVYMSTSGGAFSILEALLLQDAGFYTEWGVSSRFLPSTGRDGISQVNEIVLSRPEDPAKKVMIKASVPYGRVLRMKNNYKRDCVTEKWIRQGRTIRLECVLF